METRKDIFCVGKFRINVKEKWITFNFNDSQVYLFQKDGKTKLNIPKLPDRLNLAELYAWWNYWTSTSPEGLRCCGGIFEGHKRENDEFTFELKDGYKFLIPPSISGTPEKPTTFLVEGFFLDNPFVCPDNVIIKNVPIKKPKSKIFLCHSSKDKPFVRWLATELKKRTHEVFFDEWEIKVGDSIIEKISEGLTTHGYFAVVLSQESVKSNWVKKELNTATINTISNKDLKLFPLLLEDCEIPILLKEYKYADFRNGRESPLNDFIDSIENAKENNASQSEK
jgi:hypothetical protein